MAEVLHLEETARLRAGDPWPAASPGASRGEQVELFVEVLEPVFGEAMQAVVKDSRHSEA